MYIYDNAQCSICQRAYKGKFKVQDGGDIICDDCGNITVIKGMEYKKVTEKDRDVIQEIVKDLLKKDLNRIFIANAEKDKDELYLLRDEEGNLDTRKVYFQNNNIELVLNLHSEAYKALTYLEMGEGKEYREFAQKIYDYYIQARHTKYSEEEVFEIWSILDSPEMKHISREVEM